MMQMMPKIGTFTNTCTNYRIVEWWVLWVKEIQKWISILSIMMKLATVNKWPTIYNNRLCDVAKYENQLWIYCSLFKRAVTATNGNPIEKKTNLLFSYTNCRDFRLWRPHLVNDLSSRKRERKTSFHFWMMSYSTIKCAILCN